MVDHHSSVGPPVRGPKSTVDPATKAEALKQLADGRVTVTLSDPTDVAFLRTLSLRIGSPNLPGEILAELLRWHRERMAAGADAWADEKVALSPETQRRLVKDSGEG